MQRVLNAIEQLGYKRDVTAANLARNRSYDFVFLLPAEAGGIFDALRAAIQREIGKQADERANISIIGIRAFDTEHLAQALEGCKGRNLSGVCLVAIEGPRVRAAIQALRADGVKVVTLVTDIQEECRDAYIGLDNHSAGRTAAQVMALAHRAGGTILPIAGSLDTSDHAQRISGFMEVIPDHITVLPVIQTYDRAADVAQAVRDAIASNPNLSGIYSVGAGHSGLFAALGAVKKRRPVVAVHDLLAQVRTALNAGLIDFVIDQQPDRQVSMAVDTMKTLSDGEPLASELGMITPTVHFQGNLPPVATGTVRSGTGTPLNLYSR